MRSRFAVVLSLVLSVATAFVASSASAAAFTPGNIVVYRVGDGAAALGSTATAVILDEYTPAGVFVQSIAMPLVVAGTNQRLTASGSATTEGFLSRSQDGQYLIVPGYDAAPPDAGMIYTNQSSLDYNGIVEVPATSIVGICGADRGLPEFIKRRVNNDVRRC